jgi:hypothetical protein
MLTAFHGHSFHPHGILLSFPFQLGGNTVEVDFEVVDVPLNYNLLLGCNWTYVMIVIISSIFFTLFFPHDGKIMTVDQLSFEYASPNGLVGLSIPMDDNYQPTTENIDVKMCSYIMRTFDFMAMIHHIYSMSSRLISSERYFPFCIS